MTPASTPWLRWPVSTLRPGFEATVFSGEFEAAAVARMGDGSHPRLALRAPGPADPVGESGVRVGVGQ